ncbi:MAG: hypothetical protein PHQ44_00585 [Anaerovibrio sp.]|nr:hypothetical protein [Anaerovibrio sp.]
MGKDDIQQTGEILRKLLQEDENLLLDQASFSDKLAKAGIVSRDNSILDKALSLGINAILMSVDQESLESVKAGQAKLREILLNENINMRRVDFVVDVFTVAFDWVTPENIARKEKEAKEKAAAEKARQQRAEEQAQQQAQRKEAEARRLAVQKEELDRRAAQQAAVQQATVEPVIQQPVKQSTGGAENQPPTKVLAYVIGLILIAVCCIFLVKPATENQGQVNGSSKTKVTTEKEVSEKNNDNGGSNRRVASDNKSNTEGIKAPVKSSEGEIASAAGAVLVNYHKNITKSNYRTAYNCTSDGWQGRVGYEGWAKGFKTTISSEVSNIQYDSVSDDRVVVRYVLTAVDNPGGTRRFNGKAVIIKTSEGWKIDNMEHEAR